jgi:hypothetical protein
VGPEQPELQWHTHPQKSVSGSPSKALTNLLKIGRRRAAQALISTPNSSSLSKRARSFPSQIFCLNGGNATPQIVEITEINDEKMRKLCFECRHHQNSAYNGVIVRGSGKIGEDPILEVLIDYLVSNYEYRYISETLKNLRSCGSNLSLFRETAKINSMTVANYCNDEFLLSSVLDELRAEFLSMRIYAILIRPHSQINL